MADSELEALFKKFGKDFGEAAAKHMAANMSTKQSGYQETASRGSKMVTDPSLPKGGGEMGASSDIDEAVRKVAGDIQQRSRSIGTKFKESVFKAFKGIDELRSDGITKFFGKKLLANVVEDTKAYALTQRKYHRDMIDSMVEYTEKDGTRIEALSSTTNKLQEINKTLHAVSNSETGINGIQDIFTKLNTVGEDGVKLATILNQLDDKHKETLERLNSGKEKLAARPTDKSSAAHKRKYAAQQAAFAELSQATESTADVLAEAGSRITRNMEENLAAHKSRMRTLAKGVALAGGAGIRTHLEDSLRTYNLNLRDTFHRASAQLGMAHSEVQRGLVDYKDTLRTEALSHGGDVLGEQGIDTVKQIADIGEVFGLIGTEGFHFGMRLRESTKLIGLARPDPIVMRNFYQDAANSLNMSVTEFGEYFNDLSKDPAFASFANSIRSVGGNAQKAMVAEMKSRIKMNKILGLSNENLREQLNLENAKKWGPLADRYKSASGVDALIGIYEKKAGISVDKKDRDLLKIYAKTPELVRGKDRERVDQLKANFALAPGIIIDGFQKRIDNAMARGDMGEASRIQTEYAHVMQVVRTYGTELAGKEFYDPEKIDKAMAYQAGNDIDVRELLREINSGTMDSGVLAEKLKVIYGGTEELDKEGPTGTTKVYMEGKEMVIGYAQSALGQAIGGVTGALVGLGLEFIRFRIFMRGMGIPLGPMGKLTSKAVMSVAGTGVRAKVLSKFAPNMLKRATATAATAAATAATTAAASTATTAAAKGASGLLRGGVQSTAKATTKGAASIVAKQGGKSLLKKIPVLGAVLGAGFAAHRLMGGDLLGATGELLSGVASIIPFFGTAASVALDGALIARDMSRANTETSEQLKETAIATTVANEQSRQLNNASTASISDPITSSGAYKEMREDTLRKLQDSIITDTEGSPEIGKGGKTQLEISEEQLAISSEQLKLKKIELGKQDEDAEKAKTSRDQIMEIKRRAELSSKGWQNNVTSISNDSRAQTL